jgi:pimeloyl-ACP methyl ester carboxylesterase
MLPLLLMLLAACSPEVPADEIETPSEQIAEQAQDVATPEPTQTPAPAPTRTPFPALPITMEALGGNWIGAIYLDEKPVTLLVNITVEAGKAAVRPRTMGYFNSLSGSYGTLTLVESENTFHFDAELGRTPHQFTGQFKKTGIEGTVVRDGTEGSFYLVPVLEHENLSQFTGLYRFEDGRTISISHSPTDFGSPSLFLPGLWLVNHATGAYRALTAVSEDTFFAAPSLGIALPATDRLTFEMNEAGIPESITMESFTTNKIETAVRQDFVTEDITFVNQGDELAGTVTLPLDSTAKAPYPAIVLVHGSGRTLRQNLERFTYFLAGEGFAVLAYDKRGVGESGGSYGEAASEDRLLLLAGDAAAGVDYLRRRPDINADKIGLMGISQAGWIIPAAAVQSEHVAFMVNLSGPVVTVGQEGIYSAFTGNGATDSIKTKEEISAAVLNAAGRGFDPRPHIVELEIPGLWLFGAKDKSVPITESVNYLQEIIDEADRPNFSYTVFPNGDHLLWESETGSFADWPYIQETVPGYFDILREWLHSQL